MVGAIFEKAGDKVPKTDADAVQKDDKECAYRLLGGRKITRHQVRNSLDAHDLIVQGFLSDVSARASRSARAGRGCAR